MKPRLGIRQLELLRSMTTRLVRIVPDKMTRRLVELGMLESLPDGAMIRITAKGMRAVADAAEEGRLPIFDDTLEEMLENIRKHNEDKKMALSVDDEDR